MRTLSRGGCLSKRVALFVLWSAVLTFSAAVKVQAQTYTSDANIADFTNLVSTYATLSNYSAIDGGCGSPSFTPTAAELATTGCRVYYGQSLAGLQGSNWLLASFPSPVSSIIVFPSIDHYGYAYDGFQYTIYGSNDLQTWTPLFDATVVNGDGEPFTLGQFSGTAPTTVNNVLSPQSVGLPPGCSGTPGVPCAVGYIAQFTFGAAYQYYAFGPSSVANQSGNADQELAAVGSAQTQVTPLTVGENGTITVSNNFSNSSGTLQQTIIIPGDATNSNGSDQIASTNQPIACDPSDNYAVWRQFVVGTPWAVSHCAPHSANGPNTGALYVNACWNSSTQTLANASDAFCPTVNPDGSQGNIILEDTFDWVKEAIVNGATASLIAFTPPTTSPYLQWTTSAGTTNPVCASLSTCYLFDTLYEMYGDQTTTRGTSPKTKSWNVTALDVPTALTSVFALPNSAAPLSGTAACPLNAAAPLNDPNPSSPTYESPTFTVSQNLWFNGNCLLKFVVNQAAVPASLAIPANGLIPANNNFVAAPVSSFLYGPGTQNANTDVSLPDNPPSPQFVPQLNGLTLAGFLNAYNAAAQSLHWSSVDTAGIIEKNIQLLPVDNTLTCPVPADVTGGPIPAPVGGMCYITSPFTVQVNLDSVAPTVTITPHPGGSFYPSSQASITADYTCADNLSGVATCSYQIDGGAVVNGATAGGNGVPLPTTVGNHSFTVTAKDFANNPATPQTYSYTVAAAADVAVLEQETTDYVKHGTNLTYINWAIDLTKAIAGQNVTVTLQMPSNVLGGAITAKMAIVSCSLTGCSSMPTSGGSSCSVSGGTVICGIGTLPSVYNLKGVVMKLTIPVAAGVPAGTVFKINSTVTSANDPNPKNNAISDTINVTN